MCAARRTALYLCYAVEKAAERVRGQRTGGRCSASDLVDACLVSCFCCNLPSCQLHSSAKNAAPDVGVSCCMVWSAETERRPFAMMVLVRSVLT
jgi:hypothetical protein